MSYRKQGQKRGRKAASELLEEKKNGRIYSGRKGKTKAEGNIRVESLQARADKSDEHVKYP